MKVRRSSERGHAHHGWLDTYHTFSFADYYDPHFMGFRSLRVINEDRVTPGQGFPTHSHRDMEIVTVVLEGALEHRDSMGNTSVIRPGEIQRMSAGTGVSHSEYNSSREELVHLLQIWILPERTGIPPSYEQRLFDAAARTNRLRLVASRDGREGSVTIHQDAALYWSVLDAGAAVEHTIEPGRHAWIQVAGGSVVVGGQTLQAGDGAATDGEASLSMRADGAAELLVFDLA